MTETDERGGEPIGADWAGRGFAGLCAAAGVYAASIAILHLRRGEPTGTWLLPLCAGALTALLSACVAFGSSAGVSAWRDLRRRAAAMAILIAYAFLLLPFLGFLIGSVLLALAIAALYASRPLLVGAGGVILTVGMWALFAYGLAEPLPRGLLWR